jgi:multiple sugar transport system permease protein
VGHEAEEDSVTISRRQRAVDAAGYAFIAPNLIGFLVFTIFPVAFSLIVSFTDWDYTQGLASMAWNAGRNFLEMWKDEWFLASLRNTFVYSFTTVPLTIFLAMVLAVILDRNAVGKGPLRLMFLMPYISNVVAVSIVWVMMYAPFGPVTQLARSLGWKTPPLWLADYAWAMPALILMTIWGGLGYACLIYTAAIQTLPQELYEAADLDGAGPARKFLRITAPMLSPTTFFLVVTYFITSFQVFAQIQVMTRGGPGTSTHVLVYYVYTTAFTFYRMGYAAAISWVIFLILFAITIVQLKGQKRWVNY